MRKLLGFGLIEPRCMNPYKDIIYKILCLEYLFLQKELGGNIEFILFLLHSHVHKNELGEYHKRFIVRLFTAGKYKKGMVLSFAFLQL